MVQKAKMHDLYDEKSLILPDFCSKYSMVQTMWICSYSAPYKNCVDAIIQMYQQPTKNCATNKSKYGGLEREHSCVVMCCLHGASGHMVFK
jgi:hypothetical protein